jgi:hypothetical protein
MTCLLPCYIKQGKVKPAIEVCAQTQESISTIGGRGSGLRQPIKQWLDEKKDSLRKMLSEKEYCHMRDENTGVFLESIFVNNTTSGGPDAPRIFDR